MPTYEYECIECGNRFDAFQNMSDSPLTECEHCKGPVKRLISGGAGIIFKGSGFYVTDNKGKSTAGTASTSKDGSKTESAASSADDKKTPDEKSNSKPATGSEKSSGKKPETKKETVPAK